MMIGLNLSDHAADAVAKKRGPDELGRDRMHAARKEFSPQQGRHQSTIRGGARRVALGSMRATIRA
jgi:hypothetical protein